jgi:O-antigen ligase
MHTVKRRKATVPTQLIVLALFLTLLLAAPRARIVIGAPVYFVDVLIFFVLVNAVRSFPYRWTPNIVLSGLVTLYIWMVVLGEVHGLLAYGSVFQPVYILVRLGLAISLYYMIPRSVSTFSDIDVLLKGLMAGTIFSAILVSLFSLGATRSLVMNYIYSNPLLNPGWSTLVKAVEIYGANETAMRGRSLAGAATLTAGFLGVAWPFAFMAYQRFKRDRMWRLISMFTVVITPIGILMTYGRTAWLLVISIGTLILVFNIGRMRGKVLAAVIGISAGAAVMGVNSEVFYLDRIFTETKVALENPVNDESVSERLLSYVQPFSHLMENPQWLFVGAGITGNKLVSRGDLGEQLYDQGGLATHSGFAMSYYAYGLPAMICQILLLLYALKVIQRWIRRSKKLGQDYVVMWHSLLMVWAAFVIWWLSGHAMITQPRGVMLMFMVYGFIHAGVKLSVMAQIKKLDMQHKHASRHPEKPQNFQTSPVSAGLK